MLIVGAQDKQPYIASSVSTALDVVNQRSVPYFCNRAFMISGAAQDLYHGAWQNRLKLIIGPLGYMCYMRRSLQTIMLYEAKRCIRSRLSGLRPFQKRALLLGQVYKLLDAIPLDLLNPHQKEQILWRTQKDGKQLDDVTAWKRAKIIERDLAKTLQEFKPFPVQGTTHQESVNLFVQASYVSACIAKQSSSQTNIRWFPCFVTNTNLCYLFTYSQQYAHSNLPQKNVNDLPREMSIEPPPQWEYLHNHTLATLRLYFIGDQLDPTFPPPLPSIDDIPVPIERPHKQGNPRRTFALTSTSHASLSPALKGSPYQALQVMEVQTAQESEKPSQSYPSELQTSVASLPAPCEDDDSEDDDHRSSDDSRFRALLAVRDQLDMLHKFKGIMSEEEMARRRRDLYESMPPVPSHSDSHDEADNGVTSSTEKRAAI
jgi:hypothetical protein